MLGAVLVAVAAGAAPAGAATRVVALTPFSANTLANLGVRPVAIGQTVGQAPYSALLNGVPTLPLSHPNGPNLEQLAQRNPRLVLSAPAWRRGTRAMQRLGIRVTELEPRSVNQAVADTSRIGALVGRGRAGDRLARRLRSQVAAATRKLRRRPTVLLILGVGRTPYAYLANSWGGDLVQRAGGRLLTGNLHASGGYARISNETVVQRNPDFIIAVPHGRPGDVPKLAAYLKRNPAWRTTKAARNGRIYVSTASGLLQPTTEVAATIRGVRRILGS